MNLQHLSTPSSRADNTGYKVQLGNFNFRQKWIGIVGMQKCTNFSRRNQTSVFLYVRFSKVFFSFFHCYPSDSAVFLTMQMTFLV